MFDLYSTVLAANDDGSWIVPLLVFVIWVVGSIFKAIGETRQAKKEQPRQNRSAQKPRYKPLTDQPELREERSRQRQQNNWPRQEEEPKLKKRTKPATGAVGSLRSAMQEALEEAYSFQQERVKPKPARRVPSKPVVRRQVSQKRQAVPKAKSKEMPAKMPIRKNKKFVELEKAGQPSRKIAKDFSGRNIIDSLKDRNNLKNAILYAEILGKPKAFEDM